ncbi:DMT family transporter [Pedobacter sp. AW1-32]|uniref:DMT family transporter n=1 Tax=Pedobacter sp. AW1-32 TaxID=3383026 RepID=UPI003FF14CBC
MESIAIKSNQANLWKGFNLAILAALLWGISGAFVQFLVKHRGINIEWLVTVRLLLSGSLLLVVAIFQRKQDIWAIWKNTKDVLQLLIYGLLGMLAVQYTYFVAIKYSNAATATVLQYAGPVLIMIYLAAKNKSWPDRFGFLAILFALSGTFLLVTHGNFGSLAISQRALIWGLASAAALAFYSLYPAKLLQKYSSITVMAWSMLIAGLLFSFVRAPWQFEGTFDTQALFSIFFIIILGSVVAFSAYLNSVKIIGAQTTSLLASAEPLSAAFISVFWLNVSFGAMDWIGGTLILSTIFLLSFQQNGKQISGH